MTLIADRGLMDCPCLLQALSPTGRCKSFDSSADGYGRAEGVATLILCKQGAGVFTMDENPYAVVAGSSINQGGRSSGLTAPHGPAQTALVCAALDSGSLHAGQLRVVSVHGTGTALGDPIEVGALYQVLLNSDSRSSSSSSSSQYKNSIEVATLASSKSCFGHSEGSAGIACLLLSIGVLHHSAIPSILHLRTVNPYVEAAMIGAGSARNPVRMRAARQAAPRVLQSNVCRSSTDSLLAGSSSFGMSGVNAHMLVFNPGSQGLLQTLNHEVLSLWIMFQSCNRRQSFKLSLSNSTVGVPCFPCRINMFGSAGDITCCKNPACWHPLLLELGRPSPSAALWPRASWPFSGDVGSKEEQSLHWELWWRWLLPW